MDRGYMKRALELAEKGVGCVNPNPLVGAVIVKDGRIIAEGYHEVYGGHHAEVNAFRNAHEDVRGGTLYVTLEPCSHFGKTPPCANAIVEKGIAKVVIAMKDPNPLVSGKGIEILKNSGIEVVTGVLEEEGKRLNEIFIKYITTGRPFCIMKTAMTLDGKIASHTGDSKWITGALSREYVHKLRNRVSAIMVGIGTVLADDPKLNTRLTTSPSSDAVRVIVDSSAKIPLEAQVLNMDSPVRTIVAVTERAEKRKVKLLEEKGAEVMVTPTKAGMVDLDWLMDALGQRKLDSVLLEGGSHVNYSALEAGIVDKVNAFIAPKIIGGSSSKTPVGGRGIECMAHALILKDIEVLHFGQDIMISGYMGKDG